MRRSSILLLLASAHATNLRLDAKPTSVFDDLMTTLEDDTPPPAATTAPKTNKNEVAGSVANIFGHVSTAKVKEAEKVAEEEVKEAKKDGPKAAQEEKHEHDEHHDMPMPPCVDSCPKEGPKSCEMAKDWMANGCASKCDESTKKNVGRFIL